MKFISKNYKSIGVLSIGDELLKGNTLNTNLFFLGKKIGEIGFSIKMEISVPDDEIKIQKALQILKKEKNNVIITIGGLGPTHDDKVREGLSLFLKKPLMFDKNLWKELKKKEPLLALNVHKKYALVPKDFSLLDNLVGLAKGFFYKKGRFCIFSIPGPPREFRSMVEAHIIPFLKKKNGKFISRTISTYGIKEIEIMKLLGKSLKKIEPLSILPSIYGVKINLTGQEEEVKRKEEIIRRALGIHIYGYDEETLPQVVGNLMRERKITLATAESCTGGLLGDTITSVSGSSEYFKGGIVAYSNEIKKKNLKVKEKNLIKFGAVSEEVAREMAINVMKIFGSDIGLSATGIAGPTGATKEKPVGLVYMGIAFKDKIRVIKKIFKGNREEIKKQTVYEILDNLRRMLIKMI